MYQNFHTEMMAALRHKEIANETRAQKIDEMANDLYLEKLAALPNGQIGGSEYRARAGYNMESVISELDGTDLIPAARALIADDEAELGRIFAKLIKAKLREEAAQEADDYDTEHFAEKY